MTQTDERLPLTKHDLSDSFSAYRHLAAQVISAAVLDFKARPPQSRKGKPGKPGKPRKPIGVKTRLSFVRRQVQAGEFLLVRTDRITLHWFHVAGLDLARVRRRHGWVRRLSELRLLESELLKQAKFLSNTTHSFTLNPTRISHETD